MYTHRLESIAHYILQDNMLQRRGIYVVQHAKQVITHKYISIIIITYMYACVYMCMYVRRGIYVQSR